MSDGDNLSAKQFGASFKGFLDKMAQQAPDEEPPFLARLRAHFGCDPATLPIVSETFDKNEHPNLHTAVDGYANDGGRRAELLGVAVAQDYFGVKLAQLIAPGGSPLMGGAAPTIGPVQYRNLPLADDNVLACIHSGLYMIPDGDVRLALLVSGPRDMDFRGQIGVEAMAPTRQAADAALAAIRHAMRKRNVYRGHVISLRSSNHQIHVDFHRLPRIEREDDHPSRGVLERVETHCDRFRGARRAAPRGGPPPAAAACCSTARPVRGRRSPRCTSPAAARRTHHDPAHRRRARVDRAVGRIRAAAAALDVVLEDVDLVAEERRRSRSSAPTPCCSSCSTRWTASPTTPTCCSCSPPTGPRLLEPALASRPGRIDQAIEIPLPDADVPPAAVRAVRPRA